jgi:uncharacterized protein
MPLGGPPPAGPACLPGTTFALYHLHQPWDIPTSLVDIFALAYPSRRFQSAWMGIIVHSTQSVVVIIVVLALALD